MPPKHRPKHSAPSKFSIGGRKGSSDGFSDGPRPAGRRPELDAPETLRPRRASLPEPPPAEPPRIVQPPAHTSSPPSETRSGSGNGRGKLAAEDFGRSMGDDFWNEARPRRRQEESRRREPPQPRTTVMEALPDELSEPAPRPSRSARAANVKVSSTAAPDPAPPARSGPANTSASAWLDGDGEPDRRESPYARARTSQFTDEPTMVSQPVDSRPSRKQRKADGQSQTLGQWFKEITILGIVAVGTAVLLTTYLIQAFFIPSSSMEDTLQIGDRVLVNKFVYKVGEPTRGDIIVFTSPEGVKAPPPANTPFAKFMDKVAIAIGLKSSEQDLIKRVIATQGQTIEAKLGLVFVDGQQLDEPYRKDTDPIPDFAPIKVPDGHVFVMGDNRQDSKDSRSFGPVPMSSIVGKAFARIWPLDRTAWFKK